MPKVMCVLQQRVDTPICRFLRLRARGNCDMYQLKLRMYTLFLVSAIFTGLLFEDLHIWHNH
jgi:hypothetical protein